MSVEEELGSIKNGIQTVKDGQRAIYQKLPGLGLYLLVSTGIVGSIRSCDNTSEIQDQLRKTTQIHIEQIHIENVLGEATPEKFYEIGGQRVFLEVDGKPIQDYFKTPAEDPSQKH